MSWSDSAQALLDAAGTATLTSDVARTFVAPGGAFARDCRLLAVYVSTVDAAPTPTGELPGQGCAVIAAPNLNLVFLADCYPAADDHGKPPTPESVTAWTDDFLTDAEAIWNAVADAVLDGTLGGCDSVSIGQAQISGPGGGAAQLLIPVQVLDIEPGSSGCDLPEKPANVVATDLGGGVIEVSWDATVGALAYQVTPYLDGVGQEYTVSLSSPASLPVGVGVPVTVTVTAFNTCGSGPRSNHSAPITPA